MIRLLKRFDPLRILALLLLVLPVFALLAVGIVWLWQNDVLLYWLGAFLVCGILGYGFQRLLIRRSRRLLPDAATEPGAEWPSSADNVWVQVNAFADTLHPEDWPLNDADRLLTLGRRVLEIVARSYHAETDRPLLELTIPHALLIVERASRDLRGEIVNSVPFSHRLTIGDLSRVQKWKTSAERWYNVYRIGRAVVSPVNALFSEAWGGLRDHGFTLALDELHGWLLRTYVRKVGYYAIDLYSGHMLFEDMPPDYRTAATDGDMKRAETNDEVTAEPVRIVLLGRTNAGKSSLVNALFGKLVAASDVLPDTTPGVTPYLLERDGMTQALILDTPGFDTDLFDEKRLLEVAAGADLVLWVSPTNRPDRQTERTILDNIRAYLAARSHRRPPQILAVLTHIDQLRPAGQWRPPYDLQDESDPKAANIRAATVAVSADLNIDISRVIPVCLADGRVYNVDDVLWTVILDGQEEASRARLLRCIEARRRDENWALLRKQLSNTGRFLLGLTKRSNKPNSVN